MFKVVDVFPEILFNINNYDGDSTYELGVIFPNSPVVLQGYLYNITERDVDVEFYYDSNDNGIFDIQNDRVVAFSERGGTNPESIEYLAETPGLYYVRIYNRDGISSPPPNYSIIGVLPENIIPIGENGVTSRDFEIEGNNFNFPFDDVTIVEYELPVDGNLRLSLSSNSFNPDLEVFVIDDTNENSVLDAEDEILNQVSINSANTSRDVVFSALQGSAFLMIDNRDNFDSTISTEISYDNNQFLTLEEGTAQIAYVAYYGRPADPGGLAYWNNRLGEEGVSYSPRSGEVLAGSERSGYRALVRGFGNSDEANRVFDGLNNRQKINQVYNFAFGRNGDSGGLDYWSDQLAQGNVDLTTFALEVALGAQGDDFQVLQNKIDSADLFSQGVDTNPNGVAYKGPQGEFFGRNWLFNYTDTVATIADVNSALADLNS